MPLAKPQPSLQSLSQTPLLLSLRRRQAHQQPLNTPPSGLKLVSRTSGWRLGERLRAAVRLGAAARRAGLNSCLMLLSWGISEFLDGCAAYALAMYGFPVRLDDRLVDAADARPPQPDEPDRASPPRRPHLVAVSVPAHDNGRRHT